MFDISSITHKDKNIFYQSLNEFVQGIIHGEKDCIANLANVASLLYNTMEDINWAGFYLVKDNELVLGPFHGKPACIRIAIGKGVCGQAVSTGQIQRVENVHEFEGHIACDGDTNSEIVLPIYKEDTVVAVLDIDSPVLNRFDKVDQEELEKITRYLSEGCNWEVTQ